MGNEQPTGNAEERTYSPEYIAQLGAAARRIIDATADYAVVDVQLPDISIYIDRREQPLQEE